MATGSASTRSTPPTVTCRRPSCPSVEPAGTPKTSAPPSAPHPPNPEPPPPAGLGPPQSEPGGTLRVRGMDHRIVYIPLRRVIRRRSEEHTSELQSQSKLRCRLLL